MSVSHEFFKGKVEKVKVFDHALSNEEILREYHRSLPKWTRFMIWIRAKLHSESK